MLIKEGKSSEEAFSIISKKSRDNSRTPMQWDSSENAGFSNINPWLRVNSNYRQINVESALSNKNSVYYYYKELIELRKEKDIISDGSYTPILEDHPRVFAYLRKYKDQVLINLNNFYKEEVEIDLSAILPDYKDFSYLLGNYGNREMKEKIILRAYESISFIKFIKSSND